MTFEGATFLEQRSDTRRDFFRVRLEGRGGFAEAVVAVDQPQARGFAGQRFDAADAGGDGGFGDDLEEGNVA